MLPSQPFRRFVAKVGGLWMRRRPVARLRARRDVYFPVAAQVELLESREFLSSIVVGSLSGGQNYASTVTAAQLDPAHTAVTLRDAINAANNTQGADAISFDASLFAPNASLPATIVLSGGSPLQLKDTSGATTITGPGAGQIAVSGNDLSTVFVINTNVTATIDGLTITHGKGSIDFGVGGKAGGGIFNLGRLTLQNSTLTANDAGNAGGGLYSTGTATVTACTITNNIGQFGGGFYNGGTVTVTASTIAGNSVTSGGGGFYSLGTATVTGSTLSGNSAGLNGGGFFNNNVVTIVDSTLAGNSAASNGGGFVNLKTATVLDSTIAGNFSPLGAGINNSFATVTLSGTILAGNSVSPTNSASRDWGGSVASAASSFNLIGDGTGSGLTNGVNHNIVGTSSSLVDPRLAPLGDYGGSTQTMALLPGSPALAAGANFTNPVTGTVIATDQRGVSRALGTAPDIGAYQSAGFALVVKDGDSQTAIIGQNFSHPLVAQLTEKAFGKPLAGAGVAVNFSAPSSGASAVLSAGSVATGASGIASVTAQANGTMEGPYAVVASVPGVDSATFHLTNVEAPSLVVNTTQDVVNAFDGLTSLREAIAFGNTFTTPATITFAASAFPAGSLTTITLGGTPLELANTTAPLTIDGPGAGQVAINGNGLSAVFVVDPQVEATIEGLTITGGSGTLGGGIHNDGTLALQNDVFTANSAVSGGGLYNAGSVTVTGSTLFGNSAGSGGGLFNDGDATVTSSTLTANSALMGGGIYVHSGTLALTAVTIAGNLGPAGGGVFAEDGDVTLRNTILALNSVSGSDATPSDWAGIAADVASRFNLVGDGTNTGLTNGAAGNIVGDSVNPVDPHLGPLADNGGPTPTMALLAGSLAINAGSNGAAPPTDQRGFSRIAGGHADIGAFEIQSHPPAAPTVGSLTTTDKTPTLQGAWDPANAVLLQVTISNGAAGYSVTYTLGSSPQLSASGASWTLNLAGTPALPVGQYDVLVHTVNEIGESADSTGGSLTIEATAPVIGALDPLSANVGAPVVLTTTIDGGDTLGLAGTIDWGDGTSSAVTIAVVNGQLTVSGSHVYATPGTFDVELTVTNAFGLSAGAATTAAIEATPPVLGALGALSANVGGPVVLTTTIDGGDTLGLAGTIDWGDGTSSTVTIATVNGQLTVSGSHVYATAGSFDVELTVTNAFGLSASADTTAVIVATPPVLGPLGALSATVGAPVVLTTTITGGDTLGLAGTIDWGDGTSNTVTIATVNGQLTVSGSHVYATAGSFDVELTVTNAFGLSASADTTAVIVATPPVLGPLGALSATVGAPVVLTTTITGGDTLGLAGTIDWGDGTSSTVTIATVNGQLTVSGSHVYATAGSFDVELTVTNAFGLSASVGTTAAITAAQKTADLRVTGTRNVQIDVTDANASYDFHVKFSPRGLLLIGTGGTTFNGAGTLFIANAVSLSGQLGSGDDHVRITGSGKNVTLDLGAGKNTVVCRDFDGEKLQVSSAGALHMHLRDVSLSNLLVTGSASEEDHFRAVGLCVSGDTNLVLGSGANRVRIDDSHFGNFKLVSTGRGTVVDIEAGSPDGVNTRFDGTAQFTLGDRARLNISPFARSDKTIFNGNLIINAGSATLNWNRPDVLLARRPTLNNVDLV